MNLSDLTAQLQQKTNETKEQIEQVQNEALNNFERDLKRLCGSVVTTLRNDLESARVSLSQEITNYKTELSNQLAESRKDVSRLAWSLRWSIALPIGVVIMLCLLAVALTWVWMPRELWNLSTTRMKMSDGQSYLVIEDPEWHNCNISGNPKAPVWRPCKTLPTSTTEQTETTK